VCVFAAACLFLAVVPLNSVYCMPQYSNNVDVLMTWTESKVLLSLTTVKDRNPVNLALRWRID